MSLKYYAIAALVVTLVAGAFLTIVNSMEETYSTTVITTSDREQLQEIRSQRENIRASVSDIQGVLNNIQEGDYLNAILGAPGAIVSVLKIMLIEIPTIIHETLTQVCRMLYLPGEVVYALYTVIILITVWYIYGTWSKESD